jgi:hypothetical protein
MLYLLCVVVSLRSLRHVALPTPLIVHRVVSRPREQVFGQSSVRGLPQLVLL